MNRMAKRSQGVRRGDRINRSIDSVGVARPKVAPLLAASLVMCVLSLMVGVDCASASHFRGGTLSWERDPTFLHPSQQRFVITVKTAWRRSFTEWSPLNPVVGDTVSGPAVPFLSVQGINGSTNAVTVTPVVTAVNAAEDWFTAEGSVLWIADNSSLPLKVALAGGDRSSALAEGNQDQLYNLEMVIDSSRGDRSPEYTGPLLLYFEQNEPGLIPLLTTTAGTDVINRVSLAPTSASLLLSPRPAGASFCSTGCAQCSVEPLFGPCALALRFSEHGLLSWTPSLLGLYGVQFQVTGVDSTSGVQFTSAPADLILSVVPACPTCPRPRLVVPENVTVPVGTPLSVPVEVTHDTDGKPVMLTVFQAPDGVTLSPAAGPAPLQATLQWTPPTVGHFTVCLWALDDSPYSHFACMGIDVVEATPGSLTALSPATLWIGLKNSDAVGLRLDLRVEVFLGGTKIGGGQVNNVATGSSGFNNARLQSIALELLNGAVNIPPGSDLRIEVAARRTCLLPGHNSGTARVWFNGALADSGAGRDAGSRFDVTVDDTEISYFLRANAALSTEPGSSRLFIDMPVNSQAACPNRPFTSFGTWGIALP